MQGDESEPRGVVLNYLTLIAAEVLSKVCVLVTFAYLARALGPRDFGAVELALSMTVFFVLGAALGLGTYGARIVATSPSKAPQLVARAALLRAILSLPLFAILLLMSARYGAAGFGILAIYATTVLLTPFNTQWVFQGMRQMQWVAAGGLLRYGTFAALVLLFVRSGAQIQWVAFAEVAGVVVLAIFNSVVLRTAFRLRLDWRDAWSGAGRLFRETWFLGASDLTWVLMWYAPTAIIGWLDLGRTEHVAWLGASVRIVMSLHTFVFLYFFNLVPTLSRELHVSVARWRAVVVRSLAMSMWGGCLVALSGVLFARVVMSTLFGPAYVASIVPFQIAIWMIPTATLMGHFRSSLIVGGQQRLEFVASAVAGAVTVVLALIGARAAGATGGAAALLAGGLLNLLIGLIAVNARIGRVRLTVIAPPVLTCAASLLIGIGGRALMGETIASSLGCLVYVSVMLARSDIAGLRLAWANRSAHRG